jgi:MFS family permease
MGDAVNAFARTQRVPLPVGFISLLVTLYLAQGLPSGFFAHALPALLREQGVSLELIGFAKLLALPWFLKCFWAPVIDRYGSQRFGHYRGWILLLQSLCVVPLCLLAWLEPAWLFNQHLILFVVLAVLVNACMATQDVATDALAVRYLPATWRGLGNSVQVAGYKLGMLAGGNGLLWVIATLGWAAGFQSVAALLCLLLLPAIFFREPPKVVQGRFCDTAPLNISQQLRGLCARPEMRVWLPVLLTYKLADAMGSTMIKPMLVDAGYTLAQIGTLGMISSIAGMLAAFLAGTLCYWLGVWRTLFYGGLLQAAGLGLYAWVATGGCSLEQVYAISVFEQVADAVSTVSLFAVMMGFCRQEHEGGDYTLQMTLFMVLSGIMSLGSGVMAAQLGLPLFFVATALIGCMTLVFVQRAARYATRQAVAP